MTELISRTLWAMLLLSSPTATFADGSAPWHNWQTSLHAGEALVGKIWATRERRFVTPRLLADALAKAEIVLIGETHDNADHHRLQAWLIDQIATGRRPSVVMEMISLDQSEMLKAYLARPDANATGLGPALDWAKSGWPDWLIYQPIAEVVFRAGLPLLPGDPRRAAIRSVAGGNIASIEKAERRRLGLDKPLSPQLTEGLSRDIEESHCDLLPQTSLGPMTQVQRYRDAVLASALAKAGKGEGAILIAGNGHVRSDRGVPWYLAHQEIEQTATTVMLLEITEGAATVNDVAITSSDGEPAADYVWITPRAEREDQCEKLRRQLGK